MPGVQDATFDVIVIGAGAGGLLTAARLAHLGYRTLVAERLGYVGGRASTVTSTASWSTTVPS